MEPSMARAKIFKHGGSQAVRLPKEFRFEVDEVDIRKEGDAVILKPAGNPTPKDIQDLWDRIDAIRGDERLERQPQPILPEWKFEE
jgi:antitoxin VapB